MVEPVRLAITLIPIAGLMLTNPFITGWVRKPGVEGSSRSFVSASRVRRQSSFEGIVETLRKPLCRWTSSLPGAQNRHLRYLRRRHVYARWLTSRGRRQRCSR